MSEEARTGKRFPLELPIKLHSDAASSDAKGTTGNLSAAGVYIRADASLEIGSPVEFEITLPPDVTGGQENVVIQCKGRVVRTDPTGSIVGPSSTAWTRSPDGTPPKGSWAGTPPTGSPDGTRPAATAG